MRKPNPYTQILLVLKDLHLACPGQSMAHHLDIATADYGSFSGMDDQILLDALQKYKAELELNTVPDKDLDRIIEEGKNLTSLFAKEEDSEWETPY